MASSKIYSVTTEQAASVPCVYLPHPGRHPWMPDNRTSVTPQLDPAARPPEVCASLVCTVWDVPSEYYQSSRPEREKRLKKLASSKRLASQNIHLWPVMLAVTAPRLQGRLDVSDTSETCNVSALCRCVIDQYNVPLSCGLGRQRLLSRLSFTG